MKTSSRLIAICLLGLAITSCGTLYRDIYLAPMEVQNANWSPTFHQAGYSKSGVSPAYYSYSYKSEEIELNVEFSAMKKVDNPWPTQNLVFKVAVKKDFRLSVHLDQWAGTMSGQTLSVNPEITQETREEILRRFGSNIDLYWMVYPVHIDSISQITLHFDGFIRNDEQVSVPALHLKKVIGKTRRQIVTL